VGDTVNTTNIGHDDEIDLIELAINLWQQKWIIITAVIISAVIGVAIAINHEKGLTTSYKVDVQLSIPSFVELKSFNNTEFYTISGEEAFKVFINSLESSARIGSRKITYPNTSVNISSITPDKYEVAYLGNKEDSVLNASQIDLSAAEETTFNNIRVQHNTALELKIHQLERADILTKKTLRDRLDTQKEFILANRESNLKNLENALRIASANGIVNPVNSNIAIPNENPLYLRGSKLLTTDIEYLKSLNDDVSFDEEILKLKKEMLLLKNNRLADQLNAMLITNNKTDALLFYDTIPNVKAIPEKSKKKLIIIVSILLGGMIGLFIAIGRITFRSYKKTKLNAS
jgi:chain length determinant protein (polysaccharide antigen chain regulator)